MEYYIGQKASRTQTLGEEQVKAFGDLTGDHNPVIFDEAFIAKTKYQAPVVHAGLTTGLVNALIASELPGPGTVFLSQNIQFTAPVYIGDTIRAEVEIIGLHNVKPVSQLRVKVTKQTGEAVLTGEIWCYTFS